MSTLCLGALKWVIVSRCVKRKMQADFAFHSELPGLFGMGHLCPPESPYHIKANPPSPSAWRIQAVPRCLRVPSASESHTGTHSVARLPGEGSFFSCSLQKSAPPEHVVSLVPCTGGSGGWGLILSPAPFPPPFPRPPIPSPSTASTSALTSGLKPPPGFDHALRTWLCGPSSLLVCPSEYLCFP